MPSYDDVKQFIASAIDRREQADTPPFLIPSDYWKDFCKYSSYVPKLPDDELPFIRQHSWHLTGDGCHEYYFGSQSYRRSILEEYEYLARILELTAPMGEDPSAIGFDTPYGKLNRDRLRYLQVLADIIRNGAFLRDRPQSVLEIGGGYGGLASTVMAANPRTSYVIVDLEETLFYSSVYLRNTFGPDRVVLCDQRQAVSALEPGKFYMVPQSQYAQVQGWKFDLAINQQSMQEMNQQQVDHYCDLLENVAQLFYSCNLSQHTQILCREKKVVTGLNNFLLYRFPNVLWDSRKEAGLCWSILTRFPTMETAVRYTKILLSESSAVAGFYRALWKRPLRRFSDVRLQRLILRCGAPPAAGAPAEARNA
jgi:hypothetical protein